MTSLYVSPADFQFGSGVQPLPPAEYAHSCLMSLSLVQGASSRQQWSIPGERSMEDDAVLLAGGGGRMG